MISTIGTGHHDGLGEDEHAKLVEKWATYSRAKKDRKHTTVKKALDYIYHPRMIGCVTKMLLGHACASDIFKNQPFNMTALQIANQRLRQFVFVGIFEEYDESIRLFHIVANTSTKPHWTEYKKHQVIPLTL